MSIVGPRPERWEHDEMYAEDIPEWPLRLKVKGGLTGYAQVYGKYNTTALDKLKLDLFYITNYSLMLDIQIGDAIPTVLTMTVVPILGAGSSMADYKIGFKWWALIIAVVFVISELVCVVCVPERPVACDEKPGKISDMFKALFKNDQAIHSYMLQILFVSYLILGGVFRFLLIFLLIL